MKKWAIRAVGAAVLAAAALASYAQTGTSTPPTPPTPAEQAAHSVSRLTKVLDLTAAEQATATGAYTTEFTTLQGTHTSFQTAQTALKTAIEANDGTGIAAAAATIGTLTQQQVAAQATAEAAIYASLTTDQQAKFLALKFLSGPGGPGGRGPGGPGGPGGPPHGPQE